MTEQSHEQLPKADTSRKLEQLSDEVGRIAAKLSRLSSDYPRASNDFTLVKSDMPPLEANTVKSVQKARLLRERYFDRELFGDPAWDIMLELMHAELCQQRVSVSSLCLAANVPATTALRWISSMTDADLLRRKPDPRDARRVFVELSPKASDDMRSYFAALGNR